MKKVLMVCTFGMSTSMLTKKIEQVAEENNIPIKIYAKGEGDIEAELETGEVDLLLIGPQAAYMEDEIRNRVNGRVPVDLVDADDFGKQRAAKILKQCIGIFKAEKAWKEGGGE